MAIYTPARQADAAPDKKASPADRQKAIRGCAGTYAAAPRTPDGHVDSKLLLEQLKDLHADTYNWLIWTKPTDWEDLQALLPKAREQGVRVWVTLVPPSESPPRTKRASEPFGTDYEQWADAIAKLSVEQTNLVAWSIDDFTYKLAAFTPERTRDLVERTRKINPRLAFLPCCYFRPVIAKFAESYGPLIDGIIYPYKNEPGKANLTDSANVKQAVAALRKLLGPDVLVVADVYSSKHSRLGESSPKYVGQVISESKAARADGIMVYTHPDPKAAAEKYEVIREAFKQWHQ